MFDDKDFLSPQRQGQRVGDIFELRREYRQQALTALRRREGLPLPVDARGNPLETRLDDAGQAHYFNAMGEKVDRVLWAGTGKDGKPGGLAVGKRKGMNEAEADRHWGEDEAPFEILEVSEDGRKLADELVDLNRDSKTYERAERVSHGAESEQAPGFDLPGTSDEEVDAGLQDYLKRGPR